MDMDVHVYLRGRDDMMQAKESKRNVKHGASASRGAWEEPVSTAAEKQPCDRLDGRVDQISQDREKDGGVAAGEGKHVGEGDRVGEGVGVTEGVADGDKNGEGVGEREDRGKQI